MDNQQGPTAQWNSAQCDVATWMEGEVGGECIYMAEFLCCSFETITTLFVNWLYSNTKIFFKKE